MKVLRIKLWQSKAAYTKGETVTNRMTYPLPPYSTVIGALHYACSYTSYHPMDISIQGNYGSMGREIFVNNSLLNNRENDRNILIYLPAPDMLSTAYITVGEGLKTQGNDFRKGITVRIDNEELHKRYIELRDLEDSLKDEKKEILDPEIKKIQAREKEIKSQLKKLEKNSEEYKDLELEKKNLAKKRVDLKKEYDSRKYETCTEPLSHFKTLVKGPCYQEVLYDVNLTIHVSSDEETLEDIKDNICNFVSLGRSEDFVEIIESSEVELSEPEDSYRLKDKDKIYINRKHFDTESAYFVDGDNNKEAKGTVYYLDKDYKIKDNKRVFNKIPCLYSSYVGIDEESEGIYVDPDGYIVDLN